MLRFSSHAAWVSLAIALFLINPSPLRAQDDAAASPAGAFSADQVARGETTFANNCSECHLSDLSGRAGPPLKGDAFVDRWRGKPVESLFEKIKTTMPADWRTQLNESRTLDLVAFLLQQNGFASGDRALSVEASRTLLLWPRPAVR